MLHERHKIITKVIFIVNNIVDNLNSAIMAMTRRGPFQASIVNLESREIDLPKGGRLQTTDRRRMRNGRR
jgi:hypothetical protein